MKTDMHIMITVNPNTYNVSYIRYDDDGITIDSGRTTYIAENISDIALDLIEKYKPTFYKVYVNGLLTSQVRG
jgi:hypothetical protein